MAKCRDCLHYKACLEFSKFINAAVDVEKGCKCFQAKDDWAKVVRCKDCVYWEPFSAASGCGDCNGYRNGLTEEYITGDDFCSYGKRRTDHERKAD